MWKLTIEDDQSSRVVVPLVRDKYSIGRAASSEIRLTERSISREHAKLTRNSQRWVLVDLSSYNGCYVNGSRVTGSQPLAHGDLLQMGDYRLEVFDEAVLEGKLTDRATAPSVPRALNLTGQPDRLVMLLGPNPGAEFSLTRGERILIGRVEECQISINHPSVSRVHAEILSLADGRYEIVDKDSANGVSVNGVELPRALLDARDVIELGDVALKFIPAGEIFVPDPEDYDPPTLSSPPYPEEELTPSLPKRKLSSGLKIAGVAGLLGISGAIAAAMAVHRSNGSPQDRTQPRHESPLAMLNQARKSLSQGNLSDAERKLTQIPNDSNLRETREFRETLGTWADALFERAHRTAATDEKRELLERIARTRGVDPMRRERAQSLLSALNAQGAIDVSALPNVADETRPRPANTLDETEGKRLAPPPVSETTVNSSGRSRRSETR